MNKFPLIGVGITTKGKSGKTLDAYFPFLNSCPRALDDDQKALNQSQSKSEKK